MAEHLSRVRPVAAAPENPVDLRMLVEPGDQRIGTGLEQILREFGETLALELRLGPGGAGELRVLLGDPGASLFGIRHEAGAGEIGLELALSVTDRVGADAFAEFLILLLGEPEHFPDREDSAFDAAFLVGSLDRL